MLGAHALRNFSLNLGEVRWYVHSTGTRLAAHEKNTGKFKAVSDPHYFTALAGLPQDVIPVFFQHLEPFKTQKSADPRQKSHPSFFKSRQVLVEINSTCNKKLYGNFSHKITSEILNFPTV